MVHVTVLISNTYCVLSVCEPSRMGGHLRIALNPKFAKICLFLFISHACAAFLQYALCEFLTFSWARSWPQDLNKYGILFLVFTADIDFKAICSLRNTFPCEEIHGQIPQ